MLELMLAVPENAEVHPVFSTHRSMLNEQKCIHTGSLYLHVFPAVAYIPFFNTKSTIFGMKICSATPLCAEPSSQTHLNCLIANPALIPLYISMFIHGITHTVAHQEVAGGRVAGCCAFPS